jgi:tyrosinase
LHLDAHDFYNANIFDNSSSGVGGWGDPANDFQITTGGFKDMLVAYPSPHHIRRNFSLYPFQNPNTLNPFTDPSVPLPTGLMINTSMTEQNVNFSVNSFEGDFIGFQAYMESPPVSLALLLLIFRFGLTLSRLGCSSGCSLDRFCVSTLWL